MSFGDHPFNRFHNFNPESKLSEFRKRFEDFAQESNNRSNNMFFDSRQPNGWPTGLKDRNIYSMAKNANINNPNNESEGIPIKVFHEKSNETPINCNEERHEVNSDSISCDGSQHSHKSSAQQSSSSGQSSGHSSGFHSNGSQSQSHEASAEPRVHHIPIKVEPRDSSEPNASPNTTNTSENPLSRSSSNSSRHSVQSGGSRFARSPSPAKSVSSSHSNVSSNSLNSSTSGKPRVCQIPIKVETNDSQKSKSPLSSDNIPKVKTTGLGQSTGSAQSRIKPNKSKSGPFVTRIPVVGESNISSEEQSSTSQSPPKQNIKLDPLEIINRVLNDLQKYEIEVNEFNGTSDKKYRYLDEMLTRCIIKLDTIETEGKEEVRKARKAAILAVNKCIALLESKVKTDSNNHTNETPTDEQMVVSTPEPTNEMDEKVTEEQVEPIQIDDKVSDKVDNQQENVECNENANDSQSQTSVSKNDQKSAGNGPRKETAV